MAYFEDFYSSLNYTPFIFILQENPAFAGFLTTNWL